LYISISNIFYQKDFCYSNIMESVFGVENERLVRLIEQSLEKFEFENDEYEYHWNEPMLNHKVRYQVESVSSKFTLSASLEVLNSFADTEEIEENYSCQLLKRVGMVPVQTPSPSNNSRFDIGIFSDVAHWETKMGMVSKIKIPSYGVKSQKDVDMQFIGMLPGENLMHIGSLCRAQGFRVVPQGIDHYVVTVKAERGSFSLLIGPTSVVEIPKTNPGWFRKVGSTMYQLSFRRVLGVPATPCQVFYTTPQAARRYQVCSGQMTVSYQMQVVEVVNPGEVERMYEGMSGRPVVPTVFGDDAYLDKYAQRVIMKDIGASYLPSVNYNMLTVQDREKVVSLQEEFSQDPEAYEDMLKIVELPNPEIVSTLVEEEGVTPIDIMSTQVGCVITPMRYEVLQEKLGVYANPESKPFVYRHQEFEWVNGHPEPQYYVTTVPMTSTFAWITLKHYDKDGFFALDLYASRVEVKPVRLGVIVSGSIHKLQRRRLARFTNHEPTLENREEDRREGYYPLWYRRRKYFGQWVQEDESDEDNEDEILPFTRFG